jgi:hypothetical protein
MKVLFFLFLFSLSARAEAPIIWNGSFAKSLASSGFQHSSNRQLRDCGATDPSAGAGIAAVEGSICQYDGGTVGRLYLKTGAGNTDWTDLSAAGGAYWELTGNSGTTAGTNFLGTTDAQDVVIKRNSSEIARATSTGWQASTVEGSSASGGDLNLSSTSDPTKGQVVIPDVAQFSGSSNTTSAVAAKQRADTQTAGIGIQSLDGTRNLYLGLLDSRDWYLSNGSTTYLGYFQSTASVFYGQVGGRYALERNSADTDTTPATPNVQGAAIGARNTSVTAGNYSSILFGGSNNTNDPDSAIFGVHDVHSTTVASGSLHFYTRNAGTFARRMNIALDGAVTMDAYGAGLAKFSSAGLISSGTAGTTDIADDAVTDAKLRESAGLSVIGRSANSTGNPADIVAANDFEVLRRSGTSIGFGDITFGAMPQLTSYEVYGNPTGSTADIQGASISEILDGTSSTQGSILYRNASQWVALSPGTSGQVLQTNGAAANPSWVTPTSGSGTVYSANVTCNSSSAINYQSSPSWISSISNIASGSCTLTLTGSPFATANYVCTTNREVASTLYSISARDKTTSDFKIQGTEFSGGSAIVSTAYVADIICVEP